MRTLVLSPPDARRWALESLLLNAGHEVEVHTEPPTAIKAYMRESWDLVITDEPDDGPKFTGKLLKAVRAKGGTTPPILVLTGLPTVTTRALGADAALVRMVPTPVDGLILRLAFEDLGLPWGRTPQGRATLSPPVPDRPWGREGMKGGTVDAAGNVIEVAAPEPAEEGTDEAEAEADDSEAAAAGEGA